MNGGEISGNGSYGISYANAGESVVELNGGTVFENGSGAQISVTGGSSNDKKTSSSILNQEHWRGIGK